MHVYSFARGLTEAEEAYLQVRIGGRWGTKLLLLENDDKVTGCVAEPHDLAEFLKRYPVKYRDHGPEGGEP